MLCVYVPGARRISSCNSGWELSANSSRLTSVTTPNARSTSGRQPVRMHPARTAPIRLRLESISTNLSVCPVIISAAAVITANATPAASPTSTGRVRVRNSRIASTAVPSPPRWISNGVRSVPCDSAIRMARQTDMNSANGGL